MHEILGNVLTVAVVVVFAAAVVGAGWLVVILLGKLCDLLGWDISAPPIQKQHRKSIRRKRQDESGYCRWNYPLGSWVRGWRYWP